MRGLAQRLALLTLAIALSGAVPAAAATRLAGVSFSSPTTGVVVGNNTAGPGFVSYTSDGGQTFQPTLFPPDLWLVAADTDGITGVAIESLSNRAFTTATMPFGWAETGGMPGLLGSNVDLNAVAVLQGGRIAVVGQNRETTRGSLALIATSDNAGATWTNRFFGPYYQPTIDPATGEVIADAPRTRSDLVAVDSDPSGQFAWTVGSEYKESDGLFTFFAPMIKKTADGGSTWTTQTPSAGLTTGLQAVAASSGQIAFAAGLNRLFLRTADGGSTWTRSDIDIDNSSRTDKYINVLAMDALGSTVLAVGSAGKIAWKSDATDSTSGWQFYNVPSKVTLRGAAILDANTWMVVGDNETVARWDSTAATWTVTAAAPPTVSLTGPAAGFQMGLAPLTFNGVAADAGSGVASVGVRIRRADGLSFNGVGWQSADFWLPANSDDGFKTWSLSWGGEPATLAAGQMVSVTASATDAIGLTTLGNTVSSGVAPVGPDPVTAQISVAQGAPYTNSSSVNIDISQSGANWMRWNVDDGSFSDWTSVGSTALVPLSGEGVKTITFQFSIDKSVVDATAADTIVRDTTPPAAAIQIPLAGFALDSAADISGTASDGISDGISGVTSVQVSIAQNGRYWSGNSSVGWQPGEQWLDATLAPGSWSYRWSLADALLDGNPATIIVRATDAAGNVTTTQPVISKPHTTATALSLRAASAVVSYGGTASLTGTLTAVPGGANDPVPVAGATVIVRYGASATSLRDSSVRVTTNSNGVFTASVKPSSKTYYAVRFAGTSTRGASVSAPAVAVTPKAYLSTPSGPSSVRHATRFTSAGYLKPRHSAGTYAVRIYLYKRAANGTYRYSRYIKAKVSNYSSYSKYSASVTLPSSGRWRIRAYHSDSGHAAAASSYRYVTAK